MTKSYGGSFGVFVSTSQSYNDNNQNDSSNNNNNNTKLLWDDKLCRAVYVSSSEKLYEDEDSNNQPNTNNTNNSDDDEESKKTEEEVRRFGKRQNRGYGGSGRGTNRLFMAVVTQQYDVPSPLPNNNTISSSSSSGRPSSTSILELSPLDDNKENVDSSLSLVLKPPSPIRRRTVSKLYGKKRKALSTNTITSAVNTSKAAATAYDGAKKKKRKRTEFDFVSSQEGTGSSSSSSRTAVVKPSKVSTTSTTAIYRVKQPSATTSDLDMARSYFSNLDSRYVLSINEERSPMIAPKENPHKIYGQKYKTMRKVNLNCPKLKGEYEDYAKHLREVGISPVPIREYAKKRGNIFGSKTGMFDGLLDAN